MKSSIDRLSTITTRKELAEYLRQHDPETLEFLSLFTRAFGRPQTVAYIHHPEKEDA